MQDRQIYGYARVSSRDQNLDRQLDALAPFHIPKRNLYVEQRSGKDFERPAYKRLLKRLKPGDLLYIKSIDRLGRNYTEIIEQWRVITKEKQADVKVLDMPLLDTTYGKDLLGTFVADLTLQVMSFVAQMERESIHQRQAEGIAAAKARGVRFGKTPKPLPDNFEELFVLWRQKKLSNQELARLCGLDISVIYRRLREAGVPLTLPPSFPVPGGRRE